MSLPPAGVVAEALDAAYAGITSIIGKLDDFDLLLPSGCRGWTIVDLLLHVNGDAQGALVGLATPTTAPIDVTFVDYWHRFPGNGDPDQAVAHAQWVRRSASAFRRPGGIVKLWSETAPAAVRAAKAADPDGRLATQGLVFAVADFLAILVTEAVIHHFDLIDALPDAAGPAPSATAIALATLDGLAGRPLLAARPEWDEREAILKATGRVPLDPADRAELGSRFPLLG
jgi:hypothetical protein